MLFLATSTPFDAGFVPDIGRTYGTFCQGWAYMATGINPGATRSFVPDGTGILENGYFIW